MRQVINALLVIRRKRGCGVDLPYRRIGAYSGVEGLGLRGSRCLEGHRDEGDLINDRLALNVQLVSEREAKLIELVRQGEAEGKKLNLVAAVDIELRCAAVEDGDLQKGLRRGRAGSPRHDDIAATQVNDDLGFLRPTARAIDVSKHLELGRVVGTGATGRAEDSDKAALATAVPTVDDCQAVGCEWQPGGRNKAVNVFDFRMPLI